MSHLRKEKVVVAVMAPVVAVVAAVTTFSLISTDGEKNKVSAVIQTAHYGVGVVTLTSPMTALGAVIINPATKTMPLGAIVHAFIRMVVNVIAISLSIDGVGWNQTYLIE